ncbi:MAG: 16S rRNA (guanine(966)-N(2))-methyltransferase RsmD [Flavobacteriales bacterium]|nr:MAG: 16S rRNA (guanine(966)-N(2))-methyltransferase RsmD [Flavobacteriales bacterium]
MRIISGKFKSRRIQAPKKLPARPTTDFAKEALFNIISHQYTFENIKVLDLFAGIGSISFEFGSRGTKNIVSVDSHYPTVQFIKKTAKELNLPIKAVKSDVIKFLSNTKSQFNIIFADPPYDFNVDNLSEIVQTIFKNNLLSEGGLLIVEHFKKTDVSGFLHYIQTKNYGSSAFSFFRNS